MAKTKGQIRASLLRILNLNIDKRLSIKNKELYFLNEKVNCRWEKAVNDIRDVDDMTYTLGVLQGISTEVEKELPRVIQRIKLRKL